MIYPVITLTGPDTHAGSRNNFIGKDGAPELAEQFSNQNQVTKETPPAFIVHSVVDKVVPVSNSDHYAEAAEGGGCALSVHSPAGGIARLRDDRAVDAAMYSVVAAAEVLSDLRMKDERGSMFVVFVIVELWRFWYFTGIW